MVTRADTLTETRKTKEFYSDFLDSFFALPNGGDLAKVSNENSVRQSIKNLVLTNVGERFFQPDLGTDVNKALFEPNSIMASLSIKNRILNVLRLYEPRARDVVVNVENIDNDHTIEINIVFYVINRPDPIDLTINLKRIR